MKTKFWSYDVRLVASALSVSWLLCGVLSAADTAPDPIPLSKDEALSLYRLTIQMEVYRSELFRPHGVDSTAYILDANRGEFRQPEQTSVFQPVESKQPSESETPTAQPTENFEESAESPTESFE
jgi:hypothetical protein